MIRKLRIPSTIAKCNKFFGDSKLGFIADRKDGCFSALRGVLALVGLTCGWDAGHPLFWLWASSKVSVLEMEGLRLSSGIAGLSAWESEIEGESLW
jgi:hypothetical protein